MAINLDELRSGKALVPVSSLDCLAQKLVMPMLFTSQVLQDTLLCGFHIRDELTRVLNEDNFVDDDVGFVANLEIANEDEIEIEDGDIIIGEYFDEEDDYSFNDEEVIIIGTSRIAIVKLKAESFVDEKSWEIAAYV
ncbi:hypothetical protein FEM48_Zijuj07G0038500 [Ziziphus jujuba var. spinosa]|uniref:Uncharacterized protein n=1 Tax=Ziziphus jujuba var. spinosa TaxID=714518 RepID=A0A978V2A1_ZIZJJ|nr:hypothetical protein FEM48_Zijuj07G0038500 [Ziziphus jujuba var. spinosa]